jgi:hypothetical protein
MGNVPQMTAIFSALTPANDVNVVVDTAVEGNVVGGLFRLSFEGQTSSSLMFDASEDDVRVALETLPSIGTVAVTRTGPTTQLEYAWSVTFTSDVNSGFQPKLIADSTGLTVLSATAGTKAQISVTSTTPGNEIGGSFTLTFTNMATPSVTNTSSVIKFNATAAEFQTALIPAVTGGAVSVSRTGPDGQKGYVWSITFLETVSRITEGPQSLFVVASSLTGTNVLNPTIVSVATVRVGTVKEVQKLTVTHGSSTTAMNMILQYDGQSTAVIPLSPFQTNCNSQVTEVQTITSSTIDTSRRGGDNSVSINLQMRIKYGNEVTALISVNDCAAAAISVSTALEMFTAFGTVSVTSDTTTSTSACVWTINFVSSVGSLDQLQVEAYNSVTYATGSFGTTSVAGDDTLTTAIVTVGQKGAIKAALEMLSTVGSVTVTPTTATPAAGGICIFQVTFDTNVGNLGLMNVFIYPVTTVSPTIVFGSTSASSGIMVGITETTPGTGTKIGGDFALSFRGVRSVYLPYDVTASALKTALQYLNTIGTVDVIRSDSDENSGYTWSVTFLTELGSLDLMQFDGKGMTGTVVTGVVAKATIGVPPLFNSLSVINGLPLGSTRVTDMSNLGLLVTSLDHGIAYYFRVAAINAVVCIYIY